MSDQASTLLVNTLEPQSGTTLTVGKTGQNLVVNADSLKANVVKDAGGNAIFTSDGSGTLSGVNSAFGSAVVLIQSQTASNSASISFTSGIDSTYEEYLFKFVNINPATNETEFQFQVNATSQSGYNEEITSSAMKARYTENGSTAAWEYATDMDQNQGTAYQWMSENTGNEADASYSGQLHMYNLGSTSKVKNFIVRGQDDLGDQAKDISVAGFINVTAAIDDVQFKMSSGNFDGTIKMYGIK